jgi:hypothetical protein
VDNECRKVWGDLGIGFTSGRWLFLCRVAAYLNTLFYANLRIQRLIDQYNQLHEDADYFQNRYLVPMLDDETADNDGKLKVDSSPAINKFNKIASEYDVLSRQFAGTPKLADHKDVLRPNKLDPVGRTSVAVHRMGIERAWAMSDKPSARGARR